MEHELGTGGLAPRILNIGATRRWSTSCLGRCTPSEKTRLLLRGEDANWAPEPVCILWQTQKSPSQPGFEPWSSSSTDLTILHVRLIRGWQAYSCCRENSFWEYCKQYETRSVAPCCLRYIQRDETERHQITVFNMSEVHITSVCRPIQNFWNFLCPFEPWLKLLKLL